MTSRRINTLTAFKFFVKRIHPKKKAEAPTQKHKTRRGEPILSLINPHTGWNTILTTAQIAVNTPIWELLAPRLRKINMDEKGPTMYPHTKPIKRNNFITGPGSIFLCSSWLIGIASFVLVIPSLMDNIRDYYYWRTNNRWRIAS